MLEAPYLIHNQTITAVDLSSATDEYFQAAGSLGSFSKEDAREIN